MQDPSDAPDDAAPRPAKPSMLEYYRVDSNRETAVVLVPAATFTTLGSLVLGYSFVLGEGMFRVFVSLLGAFFTALGPITAIVGMRRLLAQDEYLGVTPQGVVWHQRDSETIVAWDSIAHIRCAGEREPLAIEPREGEPLRIDVKFSRIGKVALAARLEELRLKAAFHLLR
jgi:hypothetical protein